MQYKDGDGEYQPIDAVGMGDIVEAVEDWMDENISGATGPVVIDSSLSVSGAAAESKKTGEEIKKTNNRIGMVVDESTQNSPQLVDIDGLTWYEYGAIHEYRNVELDFSQDGMYSLNPIGYCGAYSMKLYDSSDNLLTFADGAYNSFEIGPLTVAIKTDETTVVFYVFNTLENLKNWIPYSTTTRVFSGTISYAKIGNFRTSGTNPYYGMTFNRITSVYIPYGVNYTYSEEMCNGIWDDFAGRKRFMDVPAGSFNPWMQRSQATTDNLLDDRKIDWNQSSSNYLYLKNGESIPVTGGKTIICNKGMDVVTWYDSNGTGTNLGNKGGNIPIDLPAGAVAITFQKLWATQVTNGYEPVYIHYVDTLYPYDCVDRNPVPQKQIHGYDISKDLYDTCIPDEASEVVRMMKCFAVREINIRQNAFRFGTFNVYVNRQATNKAVIKKMLETYGIDVCGFQESQNYQDGKRYNLGDYLKGWQYPYCSTAEETLASARHIVSRFEILSSEAFSIGSDDNTCLKCVIQLPRYKDYADGLTTLSYYTYHGIVSSAEDREEEVNDILAKIALDTSDFIIVCGDTNDFTDNKDVWAQFAAAGLTPVHNGKSETVTERNNSIDNIFISSNIHCLYYNVVNSTEWMYTPPSASSPVPVSDHDILYADLQFDFETVLDARNEE